MGSHFKQIEAARQFVEVTAFPFDVGVSVPGTVTSVWSTLSTTINLTDAQGNVIVGLPIVVGPNPLGGMASIQAVGAGTIFVGYEPNVV